MQSKAKIKREPFFHVVKRGKMPLWQSLSFRAAAILFGMLIGCFILFLFNNEANPISVIGQLFLGCFGSVRKTWITFRDLSLLLIVGLALIPAFKMKFWNLGGNGQILIGALAAIMCMFFMGKANVPDWAIILTMIPASILAGAIWAVIPAIFKAFFNTNESLFTLMMNYIAAGLVTLFISAVVSSGSGVLNPLDTGNIPALFGNNNLLTILVAVLLLAFIFVYLRFTKHGYELQVVGESQNTAKYIGINVKKVVIRTLALSGALCGIVGLLLAGCINHTITTESAKDMGFTAIMVAWLAKFNPFTMIGTSFIVTFLNNGMSQVQSTFSISSDAIAKIVVGLVYFSIIAVEFFITYKIVPTHSSVKKDDKMKNMLLNGLNENPLAEEEK